MPNVQDDKIAREAEALLAPADWERIAQSFFTHSAHAPVTILILELLLAPAGYLGSADPYLLMLGAFAQAVWLARDKTENTLRVAIGNLVGPALYSLVEGLLEGPVFFQQLHHQAYWAIAVSFALLQGGRYAMPRLTSPLLLAENIVRASIPILLYAVFEARIGKDWHAFFVDPTHEYLAIVVLLLGLLLGFAEITLRRTQRVLRSLAGHLHRLSTWSFGAKVVADMVNDAGQLALQRRQRSMLFMDIRGFTRWSEDQQPEAVVAMLNDYYATAEMCFRDLQPIKTKFTADEVMAVFSDPQQALAAARALQSGIAVALARHGLAAGLGLHTGPVVEGLLGSDVVKAYDVIGDAVNTAARLCSVAGPGELLVSESALAGMGTEDGQARIIQVKGKSEALTVRALGSIDAHPAD
jgi:class 3 adenylate cyclase